MKRQKGVGLAERARSEKTAMRRKRAGMGRGKDQMRTISPQPRDTGRLAARMIAPQDEYAGLRACGHGGHGGIGYGLPPAPGM